MTNESDLEKKKLELQQKDLELKQKDLELKQKALDVERFKAWWTGVSVMVPLVVGILTIGYGIWSQNRQSAGAFEIKAAELVMSNVDSPESVKEKARTIAALFPGRLPSQFAEKFDPTKFGVPNMAGEVDAKKELIRLLSQSSNPKQTLESWQHAFPGDEWAKDLTWQDERAQQQQ